MTDPSRSHVGPLTLGTAAMGQRYGVANPRRVPDDNAVAAILDAAWEAGIACLDTAPAYGLAEERIGRWRARTGNPVAVVTKLPSLREVSDDDAAAAVGAALEASLARLGDDRVAYYLVHDAADWLRPRVRERLLELRAEGRIGACGVSAYVPGEIAAALAAGGVDAVQVPVNLFDRSFAESGMLRECGAAGVTVFARSLFLQGLIFREPATLTGFFAPFAEPIAALRRLAKGADHGHAALALRRVREIAGIDSLVVGIYDARQLAELVEAIEAPALDPDLCARVDEIASRLPSALVDPRGWPS